MSARAGLTVLIGLLAAMLAAGCGGATSHRTVTSTSTEAATPDANTSATPARAPKPPAIVRLQLELPEVGLSSAPAVKYATTATRPALRGLVKPAAAIVYMLGSDGTRTAVDPGKDGSFSVRPAVLPGLNRFHFTAAQLGAKSASASVAVTWRGTAAKAMERQMAANPTKFLPAASAGLNRKIPSLPKTRRVAQGVVPTTFALNPIKAPAPPLSGGDGKWLGGFELTEYYPSLEAWFVGAPVAAPGLSSRHRIDWLYSAHGLSMEGSGIGLDGQPYHIDNVGSGGWLTASGAGASFSNAGDAPYWRTGGFWRNQGGSLTFPLAAGGWANGAGNKYVPPPGITFAQGEGRQLAYLRSVAVDPNLIPLESHIYIPAYRSINGGWFEADDTGGAIDGRHIDVYRPPPSNPAAGDQLGFVTGQRVYIVAPGQPLP